MRPGERPPLVKGMFVDVDLRGPPRPDRLVVPRHALQDGRVYLVAESRLVIREVELETVQPEYAVISSGIEPGAPVIVSDLVPAVDGMRLEAQPDAEILERLIARAEALE